MLKLFSNKILSIFKKKTPEEFLETAEQLFYEADFGPALTEKFCLYITHRNITSTNDLLSATESFLRETFTAASCASIPPPSLQHPLIILLLGTNGSGKTTSIAKLAHYFQQQQHKVTIVATDTFRAAGVSQMKQWATQLQCHFVGGQPKQDPVAIAFDGIHSAMSKQHDVILIDTSGRLHTNLSLMQELVKMRHMISKIAPQAVCETLLTLDATIGSNALQQVEAFHQEIPLSGLIVTKMDGSAKGGALYRIAVEMKIPTKFVGTGETCSDLETFTLDRFIQHLLQN